MTCPSQCVFQRCHFDSSKMSTYFTTETIVSHLGGLKKAWLVMKYSGFPPRQMGIFPTDVAGGQIEPHEASDLIKRM